MYQASDKPPQSPAWFQLGKKATFHRGIGSGDPAPPLAIPINSASLVCSTLPPSSAIFHDRRKSVFL
jgi:hypothetical protein